MAKSRRQPSRFCFGRWPLLRLTPLWIALAIVASAPPSRAQAPTAAPSVTAAASAVATATPTAAATAEPAPPPAEDEPEDITTLRRLTAQVRAFIEGNLEAQVDPRTLFDVDVADPRAVAVEVERLERVLAEAEAEAGAGGGGGGGAAAPDAGAAHAGALDDSAPDAGVTGAGAAEAGAGGGGSARAPDAELDPELLEARLALDRARLAFYQSPAEARQELFELHEGKRAQTQSSKAKEDLSEAQREKQEAAAERARAQAAALRARSEAERLVAEERVRLLEIKESQAALAEDLAQDRLELGNFDEQILSWQRDADEILKAKPTKRPEPSVIDAVYEEVTSHLVSIRDQLAQAIDYLDEPPASLERVGIDPLVDLPVEVDRHELDELRAALLKSEAQLLLEFEQQKWERMRHLNAAMESLDRRRLQLIPLLSADKRSRLEGINPAALEQAKREVQHVTLVMRYHLRETGRFVTTVQETGEAGGSAFVAFVTIFKWLLPIGLFFWWRRRAEGILEGLREGAEESTRKAARSQRRSDDAVPWVSRAVTFYRKIRGPFEWLLLIWAVIALLPKGADELLEIQLLWTALRWLLGGQLVVRAIDALFAEDEGSARKSRMQTAHLRFRTLRLLGRVVVTFGLILALTSDLVGHGTIYSWALTAIWITAIPVALVILRWWRDVIFHYVELHRKKNALLKWVEKNGEGWQSFPAAVAGGVWLLGHNGMKFLRSRVLNIDVVKRLLAYWFRREVTKQSEARESVVEDAELDDEAYAALDPEREVTKMVVSVADEQVKDIIERVRKPGGAVYAVVGERGAGKTMLLKRIRDKTPDTLLVTCPVEGITGFHRTLREALGLPEDATDADVTELLDKGAGNNAVLIDDAQHLVQPVVDGLEEMDRLLELARSSSVSCTWVFGFDAIIWAFFSRVREVRPLFDDIIKLMPWSEEGIVRLLESRSRDAKIIPDFSRLVRELPEDADAIDEAEALERARNGYYRLLWDYSLGNPAVSLHFWRASLRVSPTGEHVVRLFDPPSTEDLERLPDSAVFVLRAIVQLDEANLDDIAEATMLDRQQVKDAIRYALVRRYIEEIGGRVRVRWTWFRTITRFLARRHLLVGPYK